MTEDTKNQLTFNANMAYRQLEAKCKLPKKLHTRVVGHIENVQGEDRGTIEVSFFDTYRESHLCGTSGYVPRSVWVRIMIVVNGRGVVRTVIWTGGNQGHEEKKTIVDGRDACKTAVAVREARQARSFS